MADVKWIKLSCGLPDNRKVKLIRKLPEGDTIALMWVFLLCLAGETNEDGMVYFTSEIPYTDEMLADQFDMELNTIRLGLATFQKFGMIEIVEDIICLPSWEKWQSTDRLSEIREYNRLAKQKSRAKQKQKLLEDVNDESMTSQCGHDTEEDKEKEEDKDLDKDKKKRKDNPPTVYYPFDECLNQAFVDYVDMRKRIKKPLATERAITLAMNKLDDLSNGDNDLAIKIIEQSIMNSWQGLFPLKQDSKKQESRSVYDEWRDA